MKVETNYTIDGEIVELIGSFEGIDVYNKTTGSFNDEEILYFCKKNDVVKTLFISAATNQNFGFIDSLEFK